MKPFAIAALAVLFAAPSVAQSALFPSPVAVSAGGSYANVISRSSGQSLDGLGARGASVDLTYGRFTVGADYVAYRSDSAVDLAAGYHLARRPEEQMTTTLGLAVQLGERGEMLFPSISHARRVLGAPDAAVIPSATVGMALTSQRDVGISAFAAGGVTFMVGSGPTRATLTPSVAWTRGMDDVVSVGISAGVVQSIRTR